VPNFSVNIGRSIGWAFLALIVIIGVVVVAGVESIAHSSPAMNPKTTNLNVVPTMRSVTISAAAADFSRCQQGAPPRHSTKLALGFPNGRCYVGKRGKVYPVVITNGLQASILVGSSNAVPSDGGKQWVPCMVGPDAVVACAGPARQPGRDQFAIQNFSRYAKNKSGLAKVMRCDAVFGPSGTGLATTGQVQREGVVLVGPSKPDDNSTTWRVTITWMAAPLPRCEE